MTSTTWQTDTFGRERLRLVESPRPEPGPTQLLVAVKAVSLNYRDLLMIRDGMGMPIALPFTPTSDMSGEVVAVGGKVTRFAVGDAVIGSFWAGWLDGERPAETMSLGGPGPGMLSTHVLIDEQWAVARPRTLSHAQASTLPCAGLTAWTALAELGHLRAGQTVLIHGTGGVALFGLQWARAHGAQAVVITSSAAKLERARALGATHGLLRGQGDWPAELKTLTDGRGVDHVLDTAGGDNLGASVAALAPGGRVSVIGMQAGTELRLPFFPLIVSRGTIQGIGVGHRRSLEEMGRAVDAVGLEPVIDGEYAFDDLPRALDHLERGSFGKVVLRV